MANLWGGISSSANTSVSRASRTGKSVAVRGPVHSDERHRSHLEVEIAPAHLDGSAQKVGDLHGYLLGADID
jgi:hypothetical protein